eukprot:CAMPEP_0197027008 /NCGR_PEP_ID=MMETSP1384-20130603/7006_1 /TAXON_ID=29189 /ORGANISM="Ammonia sp." /LENGTH=296 /DNA_ID=CAMNT_0042455797 /DNA_START=44 /DNA_END=934 /DNA_ORIENTATION=+
MAALAIDWLKQSKWSIFSLDAMPSDFEPPYPSATALYADTFRNSYFQNVFLLGLVIFYVLDIVGCYLYTHYVPADQQSKMQKEQFAGHFISMMHALMIAGCSTLVTCTLTPYQALTTSDREPIIVLYKYAATFSAAYFLLDAIFISYYYQQAWSKKLAFVFHHFFSGICMCSILLTHPILTYISALNFLIEWSTVMLNVRIFARIWSLKMLYFVAGWAVIFTYPFTRIVWNGYMILISFNSEYLPNYSCPQAPLVLGGAEIFVVLLSAYYYVTVIMVKPQQMYVLKIATKKVEKDC